MRNSKIYLRLKGGLGNQLFSYAFSKVLAVKLKKKLEIDTTTGFIKDQYSRASKVQRFDSNYHESSYLSKALFYLNKAFPRLTSFLFYTFYINELNAREKVQLNFNFLAKKKYIFCEGYFQSYKYFQQYEDVIKDSIEFKFKKTEFIELLFKKIESNNSVAVHIRRLAYDNLLEMNYYFDAIKIIQTKIFKPVFFIFSDDLAWCEENFQFVENKYFVRHDVNDEVADLTLMSLCKHFIIANSSFSWWGAWLSNYPEKIVIAPSLTNIGVKDAFYPKNWIII